MKSSSNEKAVLLIVTVIGILGVVALLFNAVSGDMTGQATSSLKISKPTLSKSCSDSDGGIDSYTLGKAGSYTDSCIDEDTLSEAYCDGTSAKKKDIDCKYNYCLDGVCLTESDAEDYEAELAAEAASTCADTDGGIDYEEGGIVVLGSSAKTDYCLVVETEGYPPGYLYENYCSGNTMAHGIISCEAEFGSAYHCGRTSSGDACITYTVAGGTDDGTVTTTTGGGGSTGSGINLG